MADSEGAAFHFIGRFVFGFSKIEENLRRSIQKKNVGAFAEPVKEDVNKIFKKQIVAADSLSPNAKSKIYKYFEAISWARNDIVHNINHIKDWGEGRFCLHIDKIIPEKRYNLDRINKAIVRATGVKPFWSVPPDERPQIQNDTPYNIPDYHAIELAKDIELFKTITTEFEFTEYELMILIRNTNHLYYYDPTSLMNVR